MRDKIQIHQHLERLKTRAEESHHKLRQQYPHVAKKLDQLGLDLKEVRRHSARTLAAAALAGTMIAGTPKVSHDLKPTANAAQMAANQIDQKVKTDLLGLLPQKAGPLSPATEAKVSEILFKDLGIKAVASLEGNHLNTSYGRMGGEQHLPRYPGDSAAQHDQLSSKGITPGKGAWGYFVSSKAALTQEDFMKEKYYVAVQTLYLPNWNKDFNYLKEWYKHRKVLVVNPATGKSIIAVIADAGPAAWTTKHFGGSPEVMDYLTPFAGGNNGKVLLFFLDDSAKPLALGPIETRTSSYLAMK